MVDDLTKLAKVHAKMKFFFLSKYLKYSVQRRDTNEPDRMLNLNEFIFSLAKKIHHLWSQKQLNILETQQSWYTCYSKLQLNTS